MCFIVIVVYQNKLFIHFYVKSLYNVAERWKCYKSIFWHFFSWNQSCQELKSPKPQHFHPNFFWQFFSWNQSCQQLKSPNPQHFHEFFTQKIDNFHGKSKLNFWTKNEDFEQCAASCFFCDVNHVPFYFLKVVHKQQPT